MAVSDTPISDNPSPRDMGEWLKQEIQDAAKAFELRVKEATGFVVAYVSGELSAQEASESLARYDRRWGESLFGASAAPGVKDEDIVTAIDKARLKQFAESGRRSHFSGPSRS